MFYIFMRLAPHTRMLSKLTGKCDISLDMRLAGSVQSCQQPNILRSLSSRVAEGKRPDDAWQPTRIAAGKGANSGGTCIPRDERDGNTACSSRLLPPSPFHRRGRFCHPDPPPPRERVCGESVDPRRRQRAVAAENSASPRPTGMLRKAAHRTGRDHRPPQ